MAAAPAPVVQPQPAPDSDDPRWRPVLPLRCLLAVDLPLHGIKVRNFLGLHIGSVVGTGWTATRDVPLQVNGIVIGWGEMESSSNCLAVRVTELA